jgi:signal peptidase I
METNPAMPSQVLQERKEALQLRNSWRRLLLSLVIALGGALLLFGALFGVATVRGDAMYPTFKQGDLVLYTRLGRLRRSDIVMMKPTQAGGREVRRLLGLPGDTVDITPQGRVVVNAQPLVEKYAVGDTERKQGLPLPLKLSRKEYFVLGDNRQDSNDSRDFGAVLRRRMLGKVVVTLRTAQ